MICAEKSECPTKVQPSPRCTPPPPPDVQVFPRTWIMVHTLRTEDGKAVVRLPGEIDQLDARLLLMLRAHPRIGLLETSRRLGVARGTVQARLEKLQARGVITGFGPELDP